MSICYVYQPRIILWVILESRNSVFSMVEFVIMDYIITLLYTIILSSLFKVGLSPSKITYFICFNKSSLKLIKNAFYFISKTLFVFKIFKFFDTTFWSCRKNGLIRNVNFKIYGIANN